MEEISGLDLGELDLTSEDFLDEVDGNINIVICVEIILKFYCHICLF